LGGSDQAPRSLAILTEKENKVYEIERKARQTTADMEANEGGADAASGLTALFN
jgi:hypothetical protein